MIKGLGARLHNAVQVVISATQAAIYNVFTAAGSPSAALDVYVTVNAGIVLQAGMIATGFAVGSTITIVNNGRIAGIGGAGGDGWGTDVSNNFAYGSPGFNGGHAIETNIATIIDNTNGEIFGGGGGGAGGGATRRPIGGPYTYRAGGGGGGGGQGYNNAAGGAGGLSVSSPSFESGFAGNAGSSTAQGLAGAARNDAGPGGDGMLWGYNGYGGSVGAAEASVAYVGGIAGQAIKSNGSGVTITGGNNATQIKGVVS